MSTSAAGEVLEIIATAEQPSGEQPDPHPHPMVEPALRIELSARDVGASGPSAPSTVSGTVEP